MDLNNLRKSLSSAKSSIELVENIAKCLEDSDLYFGHGTNNSLDESSADNYAHTTDNFEEALEYIKIAIPEKIESIKSEIRARN